MHDDRCRSQRQQVEAALRELDRLHSKTQAQPDPIGRSTPVMGGDLGSRFYETVGRHEAAHRRYRTAVRVLSECLRQRASGSG